MYPPPSLGIGLIYIIHICSNYLFLNVTNPTHLELFQDKIVY